MLGYVHLCDRFQIDSPKLQPPVPSRLAGGLHRGPRFHSSTGGTLAVGDGRIMRRGRLASMVHRINGRVRKSRSIQFCADVFYIVVAMRGTSQETGGIMREDCRRRFSDRISKLVLQNSVPYIEEEATARLKDLPTPRGNPESCQQDTPPLLAADA